MNPSGKLRKKMEALPPPMPGAVRAWVKIPYEVLPALIAEQDAVDAVLTIDWGDNGEPVLITELREKRAALGEKLG